MMFVRTEGDSYVSVEAVVECIRVRAGGVVQLRLKNGERYTASFENWRNATARWRFAPAETGTYLLHYRPEKNDAFVGREKVIGWALHEDGLIEPVTASGIITALDFVPTVLHPDGSVQDITGLWPSYDQWLGEVGGLAAEPPASLFPN